MSEPKRTIPERLDAADNGLEFMAVLNDLFRFAEQAQDDADDQ